VEFVRGFTTAASFSSLREAQPSIAHRSASEAAFEAAMFGALTHPTTTAEHAIVEDVPEFVPLSDGGGNYYTPAALMQGSAPHFPAFERTALRAEPAPHDINCVESPSSLVTATPDEQPGKEQHSNPSRSSSEEAFERALYSDLFEAAPTPTTSGEDAVPVAHATGERERKVGRALPADATLATCFRKKSQGQTTIGPISSHNDIPAAAEAAFEKALYGLDETVRGPMWEGEGNGEADMSTDSPSPAAHTPPSPEAKAGQPSLPAASAKDEHSKAGALDSGASGDENPRIASMSQVVNADFTAEDGVDNEEDEYLCNPIARVEASPAGNTSPPSKDDAAEDAAGAEKKRRAFLRHNEIMESLLPPPPPTVPMVCPFNLRKAEEKGEDCGTAGSLRDALFGLCDHHTRVETHLDPVDRVEFCMPLLDRVSKLSLFYESGWLLQLQEQENAWMSSRASEVDSTPSATASGNVEGVKDDVNTAAMETHQSSPAAVAHASDDTFTSTRQPVSLSLQPPPTHREVVGRSKVLRVLVYRLLRSPHLWWDQVQELAWLAVKEARARGERGIPARHGRRNVVLSDGALDNDASPSPQIDAACDTANRCVPLCEFISEASLLEGMSRIFGTLPRDAHLFSDALRREVAAMYRGAPHAPASASNLADTGRRSSSQTLSTTAAFSGPIAAWQAFVLTHRLQSTQVCGPHLKPFSYGEVRPTITAAELMPLRYCGAASSWPLPSGVDSNSNTSGSAATVGVTNNIDFSPGSSSSHSAPFADTGDGEGADGDGAARHHAHLWANMSETEWNALLFGEEGAQLSAQVRPSDGIFFVYGQDGVTFEEEDKFKAAEEALQRAAAQEEEQRQRLFLDAGVDGSGRSAVIRLSPLEQACAEEMERISSYDVDRVVLELTNAEGPCSSTTTAAGSEDGSGGGNQVSFADSPASSSAFLNSVAFPASAPSSLTLTPGSTRGRNSKRRWRHHAKTAVSPFLLHLQNREDVQLAALWQRFVHASTGDLLDNLVHVQRHAAELVREAATEVVLQQAFWLLFYARDEVRAVTDPRRTYATVWNLHEQLMELLMTPALTDMGNRQETEPTETRSATQSAEDAKRIGLLSFDLLPLSSQVSYACFGCAHLPPRSDLDSSRRQPALPRPLNNAQELYGTLRTDVKTHTTVEDVLQSHTTGSDSDSNEASLAEAYRTLSDMQKMAVDFGIPQNSVEAAEMALRYTQQTVTDAGAQLNDLHSPLCLRGEQNAKVAQWVNDARDGIYAARAAQAEQSEELHRLMDASRQRCGRRSVKAGGSSDPATRAGEGEHGDKVASSDEGALHTLHDGPTGLEKETDHAVVAVAEAVRRTAVRQQVRDALEASVYRCFCSLRATGVLTPPPTPTTTPSGVTASNGAAALFTAAQQAAIRTAVEGVVASFFHARPEERKERSAAKGPPAGEVGVASSTATSTDATTREEAEASLHAGRRGERKRRDAAWTPVGVDEKSTLPVSRASTRRSSSRPLQHGRRKEEGGNRVEVEEGQPAKRKRGRPPRKLNPDGTYTKLTYKHSAAFLEKKRMQLEE
jgi:hypothetical protein